MPSHSTHSILIERTLAGNWISSEKTHLDARGTPRFDIHFKHGGLEAVFDDLTRLQRDAKMILLRRPPRAA